MPDHRPVRVVPARLRYLEATLALLMSVALFLAWAACHSHSDLSFAPLLCGIAGLAAARLMVGRPMLRRAF